MRKEVLIIFCLLFTSSGLCAHAESVCSRALFFSDLEYKMKVGSIEAKLNLLAIHGSAQTLVKMHFKANPLVNIQINNKPVVAEDLNFEKMQVLVGVASSIVGEAMVFGQSLMSEQKLLLATKTLTGEISSKLPGEEVVSIALQMAEQILTVNKAAFEKIAVAYRDQNREKIEADSKTFVETKLTVEQLDQLSAVKSINRDINNSFDRMARHSRGEKDVIGYLEIPDVPAPTEKRPIGFIY